MTFYSGQPIGSDELKNALIVLIKANFDHLKAAIGQEHGWSDSDTSACIHTASSGVKVDTETRDLSAANGDVAYTGYGFKPDLILLISRSGSVGSADQNGSFGFSSGVGEEGCVYTDTVVPSVVWKTSADFCISYESGNKYHQAVLKSFDADGFTLTWTKTAALSGDLDFLVLAVKLGI